MRGAADSTTLEYRPVRGASPRPSWATKLGVCSTIFGTIGVLAGVARLRQAWEYAFDPTFRWLYPPPPWVDRAYVFASVATLAVSVLLMVAGVVTLTRPLAGLRAHRSYLVLKIPLVFVTALFHGWQMWPHRDVSWQQSAIQFVFECAAFGAYAWVLLAQPFMRIKLARVAEGANEGEQ